MSSLSPVVRAAPRAKRNIAFVHGLNGHAFKTWTRDDSLELFWPLWLGEDLKSADVFSIGYPAAITGWVGTGISLDERSKNVLDRLLLEQRILEAPLCLICHSLGGLVVKQMLREANERSQFDPRCRQLLQAVDRLVFMGTPHFGAPYATLLDRLRFLAWPTQTVLDLVANSPNLMSLNSWYRNWGPVAGGKITHLNFYETQSTNFGKIVLPQDPGLIRVVSTPIDDDHLNICKPSSRNALQYLMIRDFLAKETVPDPTDYSTQRDDDGLRTLQTGITDNRPAIGPKLARAVVMFVVIGAVLLSRGGVWPMPLYCQGTLVTELHAEGYNFLSTGNLDGVLGVAQRLMTCNPKDHVAYNLEGGVAFYRKDFDRAVLMFTEALKIDVGRPGYARNLADAMVETSRVNLEPDNFAVTASTTQAIEQGIELHEKFGGAREFSTFKIARARFYLGHYANALAGVRKVGDDYSAEGGRGKARILEAAILHRQAQSDLQRRDKLMIAAQNLFIQGYRSDPNFWKERFEFKLWHPPEPYDFIVFSLQPVLADWLRGAR